MGIPHPAKLVDSCRVTRPRKSGAPPGDEAKAGPAQAAPAEETGPSRTPHAALEEIIREHHARGDFAAAVTAAMNGYGRELYRFLHATLCNEQDAGEVSAVLWEEIWSGLPGFQWRSSFRTWAYTLARHACARFLRHPHRRRARPLSDTQVSQLEQQMRSTLWYLRDEARDKLSGLRERLDPEQRALLYLRIDRELSWREVGLVLLGGEPDPSALAALRQQFARLKTQLRAMAREAGLLPDA
jgi:RNA polymerase sigma-70 factor (ECF subfamily)